MKSDSITHLTAMHAWPSSNTIRTGSADLTPMLDTIFLIILLLLATLMHSSIVRGFPVNCPAFAERSAVQKDNNAVEVSVDEHGQVYIGKAPIRLADMALHLQRVCQQMHAEKVLVRGDAAASYGRVAHVLASVSRSLPDQEVILVTQMPSDKEL